LLQSVLLHHRPTMTTLFIFTLRHPSPLVCTLLGSWHLLVSR
jgi:hypothetical protein